MLIVLDANIIVADEHLTRTKWEVVAHAIRRGRIEVVIPDVTMLEAISRFSRKRSDQISKLEKTISTRSETVQEYMKRLRLALEQEAKHYPKQLEARLKKLGIRVIPVPQISHSVLAQRALDRVPPFNQNGNGYRDSLLWLTALNELSQVATDDLAIMSTDGIFSENQDRLQAEVDAAGMGRLEVFPALAKAKIPGEFEVHEFAFADVPLTDAAVAQQIVAIVQGTDVSKHFIYGPDHVLVRKVVNVELEQDRRSVQKRQDFGSFHVMVAARVDFESVLVYVDLGADEIPEFVEKEEYLMMYVEWRGEVEGGTGKVIEEELFIRKVLA